MAKLSIALICRDEEANLPAWLAAVKPVADEVIAVDSGSRDRTIPILRQAGARIYERGFIGYADQRNFAAAQCSGDWILSLDGDERLDAELADALNRLKAGPFPQEAGFELAYKVFFFGRFMRHGGFFPERHLRLIRAGRGRWERDQVHERLVCDGPVGRLAGYVEHHSYGSVADYLTRMQGYSERAAREMAASGRQASGLTAFTHAWWAFGHRYVLRAGFLDGYEGYLAARLESMYTLAKYSRLRELNKKGEAGS